MGKICCFCGHSKHFTTDEVKQTLTDKCIDLIMQQGVSEFLVGNYGKFDLLASAIINDIKKQYPHIKLILVIPYLTKTIIENKEFYKKSFDEIFVIDIPQNTPKRYHIVRCNEGMVNKSDFLIAYVNHDWGGAASTLNYALRKKHITVYNLGTLIK